MDYEILPGTHQAATSLLPTDTYSHIYTEERLNVYSGWETESQSCIMAQVCGSRFRNSEEHKMGMQHFYSVRHLATAGTF